MENARSGGAFQNQGHGLLGTRMQRNTERILKGQATVAAYRIPDILDKINNVIGEIKGVKNLSLTGQLRDFIYYAKNQGFSFNLYVRPDTKLSRTADQTVEGYRCRRL